MDSEITTESPSGFRSLNAFPVEVLREVFINLGAKDLSRLWCTGNYLLHWKMKTNRCVDVFDLEFEESGRWKWPSLISYFKGLRDIRIKAPFPTNITDIFGLSRDLESISFEFYEAESCFDLPHIRNGPRRVIERSLAIPDSVDMKLLVPNLTYLNLAGSDAVSDYFISTLPTSLRTLRLHSCNRSHTAIITVASLDVLPPNLTDLRLPAPFIKTGEHLSKIPRSVTRLELLSDGLDYTAGDKDPKLDKLPPGLLELHLPNNRNIRNSQIAYLPRSLRVFTVPHNELLTSECLPSLPRTLEVFVMYRCATSPVGAPETPLKVLPPALTNLTMTMACPWSDTCIEVLPRGLTSLYLSQTIVSDAFAGALPRTLTSLVLLSNGATVTGKCFKDFPRTLTKLDLSSRQEFRNEEMADLPRALIDLQLGYAYSLSNECIPLLPRGLTRLYFSHNRNINGDCCADLPKGLTFFSCPTSPSFSGKHFASLPRSLQYLSLHSALDVTGDTIAALPRGLRYLDLFSSRRIDETALPDLPPNIRMLTLNSIDLTRKYMDRRKLRMTIEKPVHATAINVAAPVLPPPPEASWWSYAMDSLWNMMMPTAT